MKKQKIRVQTNVRQQLIVVLGMHRSGTSALTRGLQVLGVSLGERLIPAIEENNAKGFWEDIEINTFNNEILSALKSDWFYLAPLEAVHVDKLRSDGYLLRAVELLREKMSSAQIFAFKDPRVAKLLPFWAEVFAHCQVDVNYIMAVRHPLSVVKSLAKRDGFVAEHSYLLWLGHVLECLVSSAERPRLLVDYDRLMNYPDVELIRIAKFFNIEVDYVELEKYKTEFLDPNLRHTVYDCDDLLIDSACPAIVQDVYSALLKAASGSMSLDDTALLSQLSLWSDEFERLKYSLVLTDKLLSQIVGLNQVVTERNEQIVGLNQAVTERDGQIVSLYQAVADRDSHLSFLNEELAEILNSKSWMLTEPLRDIRRNLLSRPTAVMRKHLSDGVRRVWRGLPLSTRASKS